MDKKNINIAKFLRGMIGLKLYTCSHGWLVLEEVNDDGYIKLKLESGQRVVLDRYGRLHPDGECVISTSPTSGKLVWERWDKSKVSEFPPKTWEEFCQICDDISLDSSVRVVGGKEFKRYNYNSLYERAAEALLKISQLIGLGYGGVVTKEEWRKKGEKYTISCQFTSGTPPQPYFLPAITDEPTPIAFHTWEQVEEFLSFSSNQLLLHDYFLQF